MSEFYIDKHLYSTRPEAEGRLPKEMAVYDLLERLEIPFIRVDHEVTPYIEACHGVDALLGIDICKNLFLCTANKSSFYLLMKKQSLQDVWVKVMKKLKSILRRQTFVLLSALQNAMLAVV